MNLNSLFLQACPYLSGRLTVRLVLWLRVGCCQAWISDSVNVHSDSRSQVNCHDIPHTIQSYTMNKTEVESGSLYM